MEFHSFNTWESNSIGFKFSHQSLGQNMHSIQETRLQTNLLQVTNGKFVLGLQHQLQNFGFLAWMATLPALS